MKCCEFAENSTYMTLSTDNHSMCAQIKPEYAWEENLDRLKESLFFLPALLGTCSTCLTLCFRH